MCFCSRNLPFLFLTFWTGISAISYGIRDLVFDLHLGMNVVKVVVKHECLFSGSRNQFEHSYLRYCMRNHKLTNNKLPNKSDDIRCNPSKVAYVRTMVV